MRQKRVLPCRQGRRETRPVADPRRRTAVATGQGPTFGRLLRRHRRNQGLTQEELAERSGLSVRAISDLEREVEHSPRRDTVQLLMEALELAPGERAVFEAAARALIRQVRGEQETDLISAQVTRLSLHVLPTTNLPLQPTAFIGREREVLAVVELLQRGDVRLLSLTGPGGVGKTRLALEAANRIVDAFADGAFLVPLAAVGDPELVASAIAATLRVKEAAGEPLGDTLKSFLRRKQMLLILDNFEHLQQAALLVSDLLASCGSLKILLTSRAALRLAAEHLFPVPPLDVPQPGSRPDLRSLAAYDAVALFVQRAEAVKPGFALTPENAAAVAEICRRLDGLPLAIELAAARMQSFTVQVLLDRLSSRLDLLTRGPRDAPARQRTLRATLDWSYSLLDASEQALFGYLAVFAGGCDLEAAQAICLPEYAPSSALELVSALLEKSLLQQEEGRELRYTMLETIREYALVRLEASGADEAVRERHASYYLSLAEKAESGLIGVDQIAWLDRLEREHGNLRAALTWVLDRGQIEAGLRIGGAIWRFWWFHGHLAEGRRWLEALLSRAGAVPLPVLAKALYAVANLVQWQGDFPAALTLHEKSLELARQVGTGQAISASLSSLGLVASEQGDYARARVLLEESLTLARELGDTDGMARTLHNLGWTASEQGQWQEAAARLEEGLTLSRELGDKWRMARTLAGLGWVASRRGSTAQAVEALEEALVLYHEIGDRSGIGRVLMVLGITAQEQRSYGRALELEREALRLLDETGDKQGIGWCLEALAALADAQGQAHQGARLLGAVEALYEEIGASPLSTSRLVTARPPDNSSRAIAWQKGRAMSLDRAIALALGQDGVRATEAVVPH